MSYFQRRFLGPLLLIAAGFVALLLQIHHYAPSLLRHASSTSTHTAPPHGAATGPSPLAWITNAVSPLPPPRHLHRWSAAGFARRC